MSCTQKNNQLIINFPASIHDANGKIYLFKPDDAGVDKQVAFSNPNVHPLAMDISGLPKGNYILKTAWHSKGIYFYQEDRIYLK